MSQKSKALGILNERRLALQENMEAFIIERDRLYIPIEKCTRFRLKSVPPIAG